MWCGVQEENGVLKEGTVEGIKERSEIKQQENGETQAGEAHSEIEGVLNKSGLITDGLVKVNGILIQWGDVKELFNKLKLKLVSTVESKKEDKVGKTARKRGGNGELHNLAFNINCDMSASKRGINSDK